MFVGTYPHDTARVVNQLLFMHYPYPKDKVGLRTWEFVADKNGSAGEVNPTEKTDRLLVLKWMLALWFQLVVRKTGTQALLSLLVF